MSNPEYLTWNNFLETVYLPGQQRVTRIINSPLIEIFGDGVNGRIGIWLEIDKDKSIPEELLKMELINATQRNKNSKNILEISIDNNSLARQFYHYCVAVSERVVVEKMEPIEAVSVELKCFLALFTEKSILGIERQIGLLGELIFLEYLIIKRGLDVLDSWNGPICDTHDFRLVEKEYEIKTTISPRRRHIIHGLDQLIPSDGCQLYLISILLGPPGEKDGFTLPEKVENIKVMLSGKKELIDRFNLLLQKQGYKSEHKIHYSRKYTKRQHLGIVHIDDKFPLITRDNLQKNLGDLAARIEYVQYEVNIDGLVHLEDSEEFNLLIPQN